MVVMSGYWKAGSFHIQGMEIQWQNVVRDVMIILLGIISLVITPERHRKANDFGWFPIVEVAKLFVGIFVTIIPVLAILKAGKDGAASGFIALVKEPYHYYWASGVLSSFLDNAPTYLAFFNLALGQLGIPAGMVPAALSHNTAFTNAAFAGFLKGISVGAVFMGANTYIGNAPNFMVRSIAKEFGVPMPSFFGYMFKYSIPILLPVFIIITFVFF
jgi:Na+/H+ antiporter NhaD/arsenite permease-like protein